MARKNSKAAAAAAESEEEDASTSSVEVEEAVDGESDGSEQDDVASDDDDGSGSGSDEESAGEDDEGDERPHSSAADEQHVIAGGAEQCTFDLANLLAMNTHQINAAALYQQKMGKESSQPNKEWYANTPTIDGTDSKQLLPNVNESLLLSKAAEGTTQLLAELWRLPSEKTDVGPMAKLPSAETKLPRALPPPPPKQLTKWEQFARERGIAPKSKRSRKQFDEATGEWKHLTGSLQGRANAGPEAWPILEVKKNDDPMADPWEKLREERKGRVQKNTEARMRNAERDGTLERGSANRMLKNSKRLDKQRDMAREKERRSGLAAPAGVPSDLRGGAKRGKPSTQLALKATQASTASLGRFDKQREGEPERQLQKVVHGKKRKQTDSASGGGGGGTNKKFLQSEAQKSSDILNRVMTGASSKERERDVRKGKYAKGETAHDYDYDDGLGAGAFRKKKGRAGAGKMRKVTKKRMK